MATVRQYGYYIKGNKIAIAEKDVRFDNDVDSKEYGPGTNAVQWKSPLATIANGLEVQYVYSPTYRVFQEPTIDINKFFINGWTIVEGYLTFLRARNSGITDWSDTTGVESAVTSGSAGNTGGNTLDYIVVRGSSRWSGLHRIKTAGANGNLITHTKVNGSLPYWESQQVDFSTDEIIRDGGGGNLFLGDYFSAGDYVWISGSGTAANNGLFSVASVTQSSTASSSNVTVDNRYVVVNSSDATTSATGLENEYSAAAGFTAETDQSDINVYKAHRDFCYILTDVDVLNDEEDQIDLPSYLSKALVYYVRGKLAEDQGDLERKEYFMSEFRKMVERYNNTRIAGLRIVSSGYHAIR